MQARDFIATYYRNKGLCLLSLWYNSWRNILEHNSYTRWSIKLDEKASSGLTCKVCICIVQIAEKVCKHQMLECCCHLGATLLLYSFVWVCTLIYPDVQQDLSILWLFCTISRDARTACLKGMCDITKDGRSMTTFYYYSVNHQSVL